MPKKLTGHQPAKKQTGWPQKARYFMGFEDAGQVVIGLIGLSHVRVTEQ